MTVRTKRAYEPPEPEDGARVLVDRYWPRGVSKEEAELDAWAKGVAPSDELREWFDHDPERWDAFRRRYHEELDDREDDALDDLLELHREEGTLTLVYGARDTEHNNAVALRAYLRERRGSHGETHDEGSKAPTS